MIQTLSLRPLLQRWQLTATMLVIAYAVCWLPPAEGSIYYREHFLSCRGRSSYPQYYAIISRMCDDCTNLTRDNSVYVNCRENCFRNELFNTCMNALMIMRDTQKEYREYAIIIQEG
uniref:VIH- MIH family peptide 2 n=1 Tax=Oratosquilla oratoria TaxID=337810 RepID=A0A974QPT4_9CRUS|nr:VIH- MIH family peptide 2 [Oratosquilla oratoria]